MKAQHTYTESDKRLSTILNSVSDAVIATDGQGLITFMNPAAEILTGWEMEEASGKLVTDILDVYVRDGENLIKDTFLIEALQKGSVTTGELSSASGDDYNTCLTAKSGQEIPIDYNVAPIKDEKENPTGMVITFRDITKYKTDITNYKTMEEQSNQTISELRYQARLMKTVFDSMSDGIVVLSLAGHVLFINPSIHQVFGTEPLEGLLGKWSEKHSVFYPDKETPYPIDQILVTHISRGEAIRDQEIFVRNEEQGKGIHVRASVIPLFDENEEVVACVCVIRDIVRAELETTQSFDGIVGKSRNMQPMFALMQRAVESDITVLISGESGTGKELVARAIHFNSDREAGPFIIVNCAAIPETLIESELFGHERGAFTGATTQRIGKFERADGGTIFFDEIGDMQWVLQAKLLRVLQERQIQRVGSTTNIPVDIRVLTATNQDLKAAVEAGTFREDLFYRIAAFPIMVPPLRERCEDIPLLTDHFLKRYTEKVAKSIKAVSANALRLLMEYDFPGNVRELENTIERAVLLETTDLLQSSSLPPQISSQTILSSPNATEILPFAEVERQILAHALKVMDNNVTRAAQALDIPRTTFYRKLRLYQLIGSD